MPERRATGGDVDAYCNKCKLVLAHVITAMSGSRIVRVECKTCKSVHGYKKQAPAPKGTKKSGRSSAASGPTDYEKVIEGKDLSRAQRYKIDASYNEGDVLDHTKFGLGLVMRVLSDGKIEVIFPAAMKVMAHGRESSA